MSTRSIVPVKLSLTQGDYYTLWAPAWKENGSQWQAFLGDDTHVLVFESPAQLLVFLEENHHHDLLSHPRWAEFHQGSPTRVVPQPKDEYDIIGAPAYLAERPSYENVSKLGRVFELSRALAEVAGADDAILFFASHSILGNVARGAEHYAGEHGLGEWSGVGRVVLGNWAKVVEALDGVVRVEEVDKDKAEEAAVAISTSQAAQAKAKEEAEKAAKDAARQADPYDLSPWAQAGIDPIKITAQGKSVYSLRTYLDNQPVFLGKFGEIFTFPTTKHLVRWMVENDEHDLARVATWEELQVAANAGELEVLVHQDNAYSFNGLAQDMEKGPEAVDTEQMRSAYELLADAADWAGDDSINSFFLANPRMQDYISYMLGSTKTSGYVPSKPYSDHAKGWREMENTLIQRFSKF